MTKVVPFYSIIIPAFNEADSISGVIKDILQEFKGKKYEILVVDDGSTDNTGETASHSGAIVLRHTRNQGYGASLKTGISHAKGDWVIFMDAGQIIESNTPANFFADPQHARTKLFLSQILR